MNVICPKCLEATTVTVDVDNGNDLNCTGCEESFTVDDVRGMVDSWAKVLPWLEAHPARVEEPATA